MEIKRTYQQLKNVYHLIKAVAANFYYLFPSKKICIIAVTGTNGKTSTVWMVNKILEEAGCKTAVSSTINFKIGSGMGQQDQIYYQIFLGNTKIHQ